MRTSEYLIHRNSLTTTLAGGQRLEAKVVYIDEDLDIALVKVPGENFPRLTLAAADTVHQGESVLAIGNPGGAMQFSRTKGIVSAIGKFKDAGPAPGSRPTLPSMLATAAARWSTCAAKWSGSTP